MDPGSSYFPEPEDIAPLAIAFAKMMFAHARFENEVRQLQGAITCIPDFGEKRNQWTGKRPERMAKLIGEHLGPIPQTEPIKKILTEAITACDERNLLAHGQWWRFDQGSSTIEVRGGRQQKDGCIERRTWKLADIVAIAEKFKDLNVALFKLRREIEERANPMLSSS
jgi:hypothetical protein